MLDSPGLMDDVNLIKNYPKFYGSFKEFLNYQIDGWSGFFILSYLTNFINISILNFFGINSYYFFNFCFVFFELIYVYKVFNKYLLLNKYIYCIFFQIFPYFLDYLFFPSLQVKYIFIVFAFTISRLEVKNNINQIILIILGFVLPLIKLEASPLILFFFILLFDDRFEKRNTLTVFFSMFVSNIYALIVFVTNSGSYAIAVKSNLNSNLINTMFSNFVISYDYLFIYFFYATYNCKIYI